ncbi:hypothetical protein LIA77_03579 [Sarocladium implicatum]|nr:hypothetical protein LIA77_03579 [Sarocladium implicatum]
MVNFAATVLLALATVASALPNPQLTPDPSGDANIGNGQGLQFITGACLSNADCGSGCCAGLNGGGICSGPAVGDAQGKTGCGFGGDGGDAGAAIPSPTPSQPAEIVDGGEEAGAGNGATGAGAENVGTGNGSQFITGQCLSDADCASGCCAGKAGSPDGVCSARLVAEENGKTGCGFTQA